MLMDYPGNVTVKIDGIAASAASVIAMAGTKVLMSPVSMLMIHNPMTIAYGDSTQMQKAIEMLDADPHVGDSFRYENLFIIVAHMDEERVAKLTVLHEPKPEEHEVLS